MKTPTLALIAALFALTACGVDGPPQRPPEKPLQQQIGVDQPDFAGIDRSLGRSQNRNGKIENRFHLSDRDTVTVGIDRYSRNSTYADEVTPGLTETAKNTGIYAQARLEPTETISTSFGVRQDWQDFWRMHYTR